MSESGIGVYGGGCEDGLRRTVIPMDKRLKAIESRAKALGWEYVVGHSKRFIHVELIIPHGGAHIYNGNELDTAERLLSCYEAGAEVEIKQFNGGDDANPVMCCQFDCEVRKETNHQNICRWAIQEDGCVDTPGPNCPGARRYKLMPLGDVKEADDVHRA